MQAFPPEENATREFASDRPQLGGNQQELLSELLHNGGWCNVGETICGSSYGGKSKHERIVNSLMKRRLVEIRESETCGPGRIEAKALPSAREALN